MNTANVDGATLAYESAGSGAPVLFVHGSMIADSFRPLLDDETLTNEFRLTSFHRRGYGKSSRIPRPFSVVQQAEDCRSLMRVLGLETVHVVGHSYGGAVALQFALDSPQLVHSLALLEPALVIGDSGEDYKNSLLSGVHRYRDVGPEVVIDEFLTMRFGDGYRQPLEDTVPGALDQAVADAETPFTVELPALMDWGFGEIEAARIAQPLLCVLGENSRVLSPRFVETYETLLQWFANAEGFELSDAAHGLQMQNPEGMAGALKSFWDRNPTQQ